MSWISGLSYKTWRSFHLGLVVALSLVLVWGPGEFDGRLSNILVTGFYSPFSVIRTSVLELASVSSDNSRLREALAEVSLRLSIYEDAARENARLRSVLGFEPPAGYRLLPAQVISVTGEGVPVSALINRGTVDSICRHMPVMNQSGLVGRIEEVSADYARVQLLTDPRNRVAARVASSREMGIVRFLPTEGMVLASFPNQGRVAVGDTVISSGLGGIYPAGLAVGVVTSVERPENRPHSRVTLAPAASYRSIEELFVLMPGVQ